MPSLDSAPRASLLVVDDEQAVLEDLAAIFRGEGYEVVTARTGGLALGLIERRAFDVVVTELRTEAIDCFQVLRRCREMNPFTEVVVLTSLACIASAVDAVKRGAYHYLCKPADPGPVRAVVAQAVEAARLRREAAEAHRRGGADVPVTIVTRDPQMLRLLDLARQVAPTDCTVLITGESGTGKELFARFIHHHSGRAKGPFLAINCGAFNEELLANELFGHERGAYTGASSDKKGLIEMAVGGTLFLDEVTEMSPAMQVRLLRVVQERELLRIGGTAPVKVDVRFVAATNRDMAAEVAAGRFRRDLYFRLHVVNLDVPPLSARRGDIPLLATYFLQKLAEAMHKPVTEIAGEAMAFLKSYDYPGNVRELRNVIERGVALAPGSTIGAELLPQGIRGPLQRLVQRREDGVLPSLEEQEREYIRWVLAEANGNQSLAARILGIDRVSLWRKLKRYEMAAGEG